ncbi:MAG: thiamine pyrophosphate-dependent enzyme, partial [Planctomycetota bacterium]
MPSDSSPVHTAMASAVPAAIGSKVAAPRPAPVVASTGAASFAGGSRSSGRRSAVGGPNSPRTCSPRPGIAAPSPVANAAP